MSYHRKNTQLLKNSISGIFQTWPEDFLGFYLRSIRQHSRKIKETQMQPSHESQL